MILFAKHCTKSEDLETHPPPPPPTGTKNVINSKVHEVGNKNLCAMLCLLHYGKYVQIIIYMSRYSQTFVSKWDQRYVSAPT